MSTSSAAVEAFVAAAAKDPATFNPQISPEDEMFLYDLPAMRGDAVRTSIHYLAQGKRICTNLSQIVAWYFPGGFASINSFLEFACGYGRLTRYLTQEMPAQRIWASDIYADAVAFQQKAFAVNAIVSTRVPEDFRPGRTFDCIYVGSLFSHLPQRTFTGWLRRLYELLTPGGLLALSVLDFSRMPASQSRPSGGYVFAPASESRSLDPQEYGTTHVNESFVRRQIAQVSDNAASSLRIARGLAAHQDIYLVSNRPLPDPSSLGFAHSPEGFVDVCRVLPDGRLHLFGWAADLNECGGIRDVGVYLNGQLRATFGQTLDRQDVARYFGPPVGPRCGWECHLQPGAFAASDSVLLKVTNHRGLEHIICSARLADLLVYAAPKA